MKRKTKRFFKQKDHRRDRHAANQSLRTGHSRKINFFLGKFKSHEY